MTIKKKDLKKNSEKSKKPSQLKKKPVYVRKSLGTVLAMTSSHAEIRGRRQMEDARMDVSKWGKKVKKQPIMTPLELSVLALWLFIAFLGFRFL